MSDTIGIFTTQLRYILPRILDHLNYGEWSKLRILNSHFLNVIDTIAKDKLLYLSRKRKRADCIKMLAQTSDNTKYIEETSFGAQNDFTKYVITCDDQCLPKILTNSCDGCDNMFAYWLLEPCDNMCNKNLYCILCKRECDTCSKSIATCCSFICDGTECDKWHCIKTCLNHCAYCPDGYEYGMCCMHKYKNPSMTKKKCERCYDVLFSISDDEFSEDMQNI